MNQTDLSNHIALKKLVDTFSNLADTKDVEAQLQLFKEDAELISINQGETFQSTGREAIGAAFQAYLDLFHTVYHINGQQTLDIQSETEASGISYCQVVLIREENGQDILTTSGVRYQDYYEKVDGVWLIAKRTSHFMWTKIDKIDK